MNPAEASVLVVVVLVGGWVGGGKRLLAQVMTHKKPINSPVMRSNLSDSVSDLPACLPSTFLA